MATNKVRDLIAKEKKRQDETLMMIPSENYTYPEVREAVGSILMHKYAEGDPGRRYYQGNEFVDQIESLCEDLALRAFGLDSDKWHANVQPHSGCEANLAVYHAFLEKNDKIMSMYLPDGGHLSHGWFMGEKRITLVSKLFDIEFYHVEADTKTFDYDKIAKQARKVKPKMIITGGTAYPREIDYKEMAEVAKSVGAIYLADIAHEAGLIAAGVMDSPFPHADVVTMTTHKTLRGPRGAVIITKKRFGERIDRAIIPGLQGGPHIHSIAGIAVALDKTETIEFRKYAANTIKNAKTLASELQKYDFDVVSGGTDKHLVLVDLRNKGANGWFIAWALEYAGIVTNRNTVPYDTGSPFYPSGLRLGTPALTVRGMGVAEMKLIAGWINEAVEAVGKRELPKHKEERLKYLRDFKQKMQNHKKLSEIAEKVKKLCKKYPI
ncbi:serine hydroxymethyltransferase [Patescibacteria group bacterium]